MAPSRKNETSSIVTQYIHYVLTDSYSHLAVICIIGCHLQLVHYDRKSAKSENKFIPEHYQTINGIVNQMDQIIQSIELKSHHIRELLLIFMVVIMVMTERMNKLIEQ